jgi:hypothetical protein
MVPSQYRCRLSPLDNTFPYRSRNAVNGSFRALYLNVQWMMLAGIEILQQTLNAVMRVFAKKKIHILSLNFNRS